MITVIIRCEMAKRFIGSQFLRGKRWTNELEERAIAHTNDSLAQFTQLRSDPSIAISVIEKALSEDCFNNSFACTVTTQMLLCKNDVGDGVEHRELP